MLITVSCVYETQIEEDIYNEIFQEIHVYCISKVFLLSL